MNSTQSGDATSRMGRTEFPDQHATEFPSPVDLLRITNGTLAIKVANALAIRRCVKLIIGGLIGLSCAFRFDVPLAIRSSNEEWIEWCHVRTEATTLAVVCALFELTSSL